MLSKSFILDVVLPAIKKGTTTTAFFHENHEAIYAELSKGSGQRTVSARADYEQIASLKNDKLTLKALRGWGKGSIEDQCYRPLLAVRNDPVKLAAELERLINGSAAPSANDMLADTVRSIFPGKSDSDIVDIINAYASADAEETARLERLGGYGKLGKPAKADDDDDDDDADAASCTAAE
jgi:hypothetical protein